MEVGNKVLCKSDYNDPYVIKKGEYYTIDSKFIMGGNMVVIINHIIFSTKEFDGYYYYDYFYSEKENRKMKLNKINGSR